MRIKFPILFLFIFAVSVAVMFTETEKTTVNETQSFTKHRKTTPYTIMIYMNGSDLESEYGAATDDLAEILDNETDSRNVNILILTGGTNRWQNDAIPETECVIWHMADGFLNEVKSLGSVNMGNPQTLKEFLQFCLENYPAEKTGLIMWDHGGGSIAGFGHDEQFDDASLTLLDMKKAFSEAGLAENKLEFMGFDACLMGTVEMAILASDFAKVFIASEDLEPGEGWNYNFLTELNKKPNMCGFELGELIVDTFMDFYEEMELTDEEVLTLSVVDLSKTAPVMDAMGELVSRAHRAMPQLDRPTFHRMATRRANTKTFGEGSPRDNYADMVDIGDMAVQLADIFPEESSAVLKALEDCVTYNRHNSDVEIYGLSTFYIFGGKSEGEPSLRTYSALEMNDCYTLFLHRFFDGLKTHSEKAEIIQTDYVLWEHIQDETYRMVGLKDNPDNLWAVINDTSVCLFPVTSTENARRYAVPAQVNNHAADILLLFSPEYPEGKILGIRHNSHNVFQKGHDPISIGDTISFYHLQFDFNTQTETWKKTEPFIVKGDPVLTFSPAPPNFLYGERFTDALHNISYSYPNPTQQMQYHIWEQ